MQQRGPVASLWLRRLHDPFLPRARPVDEDLGYEVFVKEGAVFVTGATGTVGSAVVEHLRDRGVPVIAGVRDSDDPSRRPSGVEVRPFTFGSDRRGFGSVLDGADRLFLLRPPAIADVRGNLFPVVDAAREVGVRQVVFLSLQGVQVNRATPHYAVEQYLRETDTAYTFLRPNFFMQNLSSTYADDIRDADQIYLPAGRSFTAFIDARDVGRVAATVLTEPGHLRTAYTLSGERPLSYARVAAILSDVLGRRIRYVRPSERAYLQTLTRRGLPADYVAVQKMLYRVVRRNLSALPNRTVRRLTGAPATTFRQFASDYRSVWLSGHYSR